MAASKRMSKRPVLRVQVHELLAIVQDKRMAKTVQDNIMAKTVQTIALTQEKIRGPYWSRMFVYRWSQHCGIVNKQRRHRRNQKNADLSVSMCVRS